MIVREPRDSECEALTELCLRSKAHWGYDVDFMEACRDELTVSPKILRERFCRLAEDGEILGLVEVGQDQGSYFLEKLFVDPDAMDKGVGRLLMDVAIAFATADGAQELIIEADPDAAPFYRRFGAFDAGQVASGSIPGRALPRLVLPVQS